MNAISVVVTKPCVWKLGTFTDRQEALQNQFVQVGSENSEVVNSIVSTIDTDDLEKQRSANADFKKFLPYMKP